MYKPLITNANKKFVINRWISYSFKLQREVFLFSDLEYEHWLIIESNPIIIDFCESALLMYKSWGVFYISLEINRC